MAAGAQTETLVDQLEGARVEREGAVGGVRQIRQRREASGLEMIEFRDFAQLFGRLHDDRRGRCFRERRERNGRWNLRHIRQMRNVRQMRQRELPKQYYGQDEESYHAGFSFRRYVVEPSVPAARAARVLRGRTVDGSSAFGSPNCRSGR